MAMSLKRLKNDFEAMKNDPPPLCTAGPEGDDLYKWKAIIMGPPHSPYEGGLFKLSIDFPPNYPFSPPKCLFITKIYHPNINFETGGTCLNILKEKDWKSVYGCSQILLAITALIDDPNPDDPYNTRAAVQYKNDRKAFDKTAAEMTQKYAMEN